MTAISALGLRAGNYKSHLEGVEDGDAAPAIISGLSLSTDLKTAIVLFS
jgi:hypothetical protein